MQKNKFFIKYNVGYWDGEEIRQNGFGAMDAFMLVSIVKEEDGASFQMLDLDGSRNTPLSGPQVFEVLVAIADIIANYDDLVDWQRALCVSFLDDVKQIITEN